MHDYDIFLEKIMDYLLLNKNNLLNKNPHFKEFFKDFLGFLGGKRQILISKNGD